jgi:hypothetical protein
MAAWCRTAPPARRSPRVYNAPKSNDQQVFVNVGMTVRWVPVAGIPLPFVSLGGSSPISNFLGLGVLESALIHAQARRYDTQPAVSVPASVRLHRRRLPLQLAGGASGARGRAPAARRPGRPGRGR